MIVNKCYLLVVTLLRRSKISRVFIEFMDDDNDNGNCFVVQTVEWVQKLWESVSSFVVFASNMATLLKKKFKNAQNIS